MAFDTSTPPAYALCWTLEQPRAIKYNDHAQVIIEYDIDPDIDVTARVESVSTTCSRGHQYNIEQHHIAMMYAVGAKRGGLPNICARSEQIPQDGQHWLPGPLANGKSRTAADPLVATITVTFTGLVRNVRAVVHRLPLPTYFIRRPWPADGGGANPATHIEPAYLQNKAKPITYACLVGETLLPVIEPGVSSATYDMVVRNMPYTNPPLTLMNADALHTYVQPDGIAYLTIIDV